MKINKAKTSNYDLVTSECIYDYIREYANYIYLSVEPQEDKTGNSYKNKREQFAKIDRTQLKAIAAELETVQKRLKWILHGQY